MLGVKNYTREYIDACLARVDADVAAYDGAIKGEAGPTAEALENAYFSNLVIVLDAMFVHRLRVVEGKDGNPLNEVRMLCNSILQNGGIMTADKTIKMVPEKTVLEIPFGAEIKIDRARFVAISKAFFTEIESKFL